MKPSGEILSHFAGLREEGPNKWKAVCPCHNDADASLAIDFKEGKWLFHCFAGCTMQNGKYNPNAVLKAAGLRKDDILPEWTGITLAEYAAAKLLPAEYLAAEWGASEGRIDGKPIIHFPYYDRKGEALAVRSRYCLQDQAGQQRFKWRKGDRGFVYGLWRMPDAPWLVLAEGESDTQTLAFNGFPAAGVPGGGMYHPDRDDRELSGYKQIYVSIEKDKGGKTLYESFSRSTLLDRVYFFTFRDFKDISDAWTKCGGDREKFRAAMNTALEGAKPFQDFDRGVFPADPAQRETRTRAQTSPENGARGGRPRADYYRFAREFHSRREREGRRVIWTRETWYEYDGTRYRERTNAEFAAVMMGEIQRHIEEGNDCHLEPSSNAAREAMANLQPLAFCEMETLDNARIVTDGDGRRRGAYEPETLAMSNCLLHIGREVTEEPKTQDFFSTGATDYPYDPAADAPTFSRYLQEAQPDRGTRNAIQEITGYILGRDRSQQKIFVFVGDGGNGKSVLLRIIEALLGAESVSTLSLGNMSERFNSIQLAQRRLNICEEITIESNDRKMPAYMDALKNISGGGMVHCERKGKTPFHAKAVSQLVFAANRFPYLSDISRGLKRRMVFVPFRQNFEGAPEKRPRLAEEIISREMPGVLNWAITGLLRANEKTAQGGQTTLFESEEIREATREYWEKANPLEAILREYLVPEEGAAVSHKGLYALAKAELAEMGMRGRSARTLQDTVEAIFKVKKERPRKYGRLETYTGLRCIVDKAGDGTPINLSAEHSGGYAEEPPF